MQLYYTAWLGSKLEMRNEQNAYSVNKLQWGPDLMLVQSKASLCDTKPGERSVFTSLFKGPASWAPEEEEGWPGASPPAERACAGRPMSSEEEKPGNHNNTIFYPFPSFFMARVQRHALVSNISLFIYLENLWVTRPLWSFGRVSQEFGPSTTRLNYPHCCFSPAEVVFISTKRRASLPVCPHSNCPTKRARQQIYKPKLTPRWRSTAADLYRGTSNDHIVLKTYDFLQWVLDFGGMAWFYTNTSASKVQHIIMLLMEQIDHIP